MLNDLVRAIVTRYSVNPNFVIDYDYKETLTQENFKVIKDAFDLHEHHLSYLDCSGDDCYEEVEVKTKHDGRKYVQCYDCNKLDLIDESRDLAYKITLDGISDFLIGLLKIDPNKTIIKSDEAIYLGKKQLPDSKGLEIDFYLLRSYKGKVCLLDYCKSYSKTNPIIIIRLSKDCLITDEKADDCWFCELVVYDDKLKELIIDNEFLDKLTAGFKSEKLLLDQSSAIKENDKKYGAGGNKRAEIMFSNAKEYVLKEYQKLKSEHRSKKDVAKIIYKNFPPGVFPTILSEDTIYRYILKDTKVVK